MANSIYNSFKRNVLNGAIDLDTDTINVMLVTAAYTPDQDAFTRLAPSVRRWRHDPQHRR